MRGRSLITISSQGSWDDSWATAEKTAAESKPRDDHLHPDKLEGNVRHCGDDPCKCHCQGQ